MWCKISSQGKLQDEAKRNINKPASHLKIAWKNKSRNYEASIRQVKTYGMKRKAATTKSMLRTTKMKTIHPIIGNFILGIRRNKYLRKEISINYIVRWIIARRRCWNSHVSWKSLERVDPIARDNIPKSGRPLNMPLKRLKNCCHSTFQERT